MLTEHFCWFILPLQLVPPSLAVSLSALVVLPDLSHHHPEGRPCVHGGLWPAFFFLLLIGRYKPKVFLSNQIKLLLTTQINEAHQQHCWYVSFQMCFSSDNDRNVISVVFLSPCQGLVIVLYVDTRVGRKKHPNTLQEKNDWPHTKNNQIKLDKRINTFTTREIEVMN